MCFELEIKNILDKKIYKEIYIKKYYYDLYKEVILYNEGLKISFLNKLYNYIHKTKGEFCGFCGKLMKFKEKMQIGYGKYCSKKCTSKGTREIVKQTNIKNFGCEYPMQNKEVLKKQQETNLKRYGTKFTSQTEEVKNKAKQTNLKKYGVENISQSEEIKNKRKNNLIKKYGVDNTFKIDGVKDKIKQTIRERFNVDHISQSTEIRKKTEETNMKKYGTKFPIVLPENRKKLQEYNQKTYGTDFPMQNNEIRKKINKTIKDKYGVENISQSEEIKEKKRNNIVIKWAKKLNLNSNNITYNEGIFTIKNHCIIHDEYQIKYDDLYNRTYMGCENICTKCNKINKQSHIKEGEIKDFIKTIISDEIIYNDRKILNGEEIDILLPKQKIGIEFDGFYYHSDIFVTNNNYHLNKTILGEKKDIKLIHIFEDEWVFKKDIVKWYIKERLNIIENIISNNECFIKEIDKIEAENFYNNNSLSNIVGDINIGLLFNNELISLISFIKKENIYYISNNSNKQNFKIINGLSKILDFFIKIYEPSKIHYLIDQRYDKSDEIINFGFKFKNNTNPNCYYFNKSNLKRYHENDKNLKEIEMIDIDNMDIKNIHQKSFFKIYDCGYKLFELLIK